MPKQTIKSKCCNANVTVVGEVTKHWRCDTCSNACDIKEQDTLDNLKERAREGLIDYVVKRKTNTRFTDDILNGVQDVVYYYNSIIDQAILLERERLQQNIGFLRQYLNERDNKTLITNKEIETFLNIK